MAKSTEEDGGGLQWKWCVMYGDTPCLLRTKGPFVRPRFADGQFFLVKPVVVGSKWSRVYQNSRTSLTFTS